MNNHKHIDIDPFGEENWEDVINNSDLIKDIVYSTIEENAKINEFKEILQIN